MTDFFPAKLILSAIREDDGSRRVVCFADGKICENDEQLSLRQSLYESWELSQGAKPYNYTAASLRDIDEALADIRATLEAQIHDEAGDDHTPPAPSSPPSVEQEPTRSDDSTIPDLSQVETVRPQWGHRTGTDAIIDGNWVAWDDRPFAEVEALAQSLGWTQIGTNGTMLNPAFS